METWKNYIDGKFADAASGRTYDALNPATGEVLDAAAADRSWSSNSSGASVRRMCHWT